MNTSLESMEDELSRLRAKVSELEKDRTFHNHHVTPQVHADLMLIEKAKLEGTSNNSHLYPELKIQFLEAKLTRAEAVIEKCSAALNEVEDLIGETSGVYGLHLNGDVSPWPEIEQGGRFERLCTMPEALAAITEYREGK